MNWTIREAAYVYTSLGWHVFPVQGITASGVCTCRDGDRCSSPGKHPLTSNGLYAATCDPVMVDEWIDRWPFMNLGIVTGEKSGFFVVDIDPDHGGAESFRQIQSEYGSVPDTVIAQTGGGGEHYLFAWPRKVIANKVALAPGIDVRGDAGYIVAPPSLHQSGRRYVWEIEYDPLETAISEAPEWLLVLIEASATPRAARLPETLPVGSRNNYLMSLAGSMRERDASRGAIYAALCWENEHRCHPPLPDKEIADIASGVMRYPSHSERQQATAHLPLRPRTLDDDPVQPRAVAFEQPPMPNTFKA